MHYLQRRKKPLVIEIYHGSVDSSDECLLNTDVVIGIEIIEHLYPITLDQLPWNIFGVVQPKLAIFTTPNVEFNVLFEMKTQFRHDDHKFEWTRQQFQDWALNICTRYTNYLVSFYGVGSGPDDTEHLGCCSQLAIFINRDFWHLTNSSDDNFIDDKIIEITDLIVQKQLIINEKLNNTDNFYDTSKISYTKLGSFDYPINCDNRTREERIYDEIRFQINRLQQMNKYYNSDTLIIEIPLVDIHAGIMQLDLTLDEIRQILRSKSKYKVNSSDKVEIHEDSDDDNSEDKDDDGDNDHDDDDKFNEKVVVEDSIEWT